jgi:hypothetical protein
MEIGLMLKKRINSNGVYVYPCEHNRVDYKALEKLCKKQQKELLEKDKDIKQLLGIIKKKQKEMRELHRIAKEFIRRNDKLINYIKKEREIVH